MKITTSSGKTYKVQFVHSSHNFQTQEHAEAGGLRQFVDNLALSLRRRVSFCDISLVEIDPVVRMDATEETKPVYKYTSLGQGFALCYHKDQFEKKTGRAYAFDRALLNAQLDFVEQSELWVGVWGEYAPSRPSDFGF